MLANYGKLHYNKNIHKSHNNYENTENKHKCYRKYYSTNV